MALWEWFLYRAVQNFNDGKAQEYRDRTEYNINNYTTPHRVVSDDVVETTPTCSVSKITLFATNTCPNCQAAKTLLNEHGVDYNVIYADGTDEAGIKTAIQLGVKQAPTLVLPDGTVYENISNITQFVESL